MTKPIKKSPIIPLKEIILRLKGSIRFCKGGEVVVSKDTIEAVLSLLEPEKAVAQDGVVES